MSKISDIGLAQSKARRRNPLGAVATGVVAAMTQHALTRSNPVPESSQAGRAGAVKTQRDRARLLYTRFTGHKAGKEVLIDKPVCPDVMSVIGDIDGILYTTVRDGKTEKYIHKFKKNARPLFCVSPDGLSIHLIGGSYVFGERGIEDK